MSEAASQQPVVTERAEQPCVFIPITTTMADLGGTVPPLTGDAMRFLAARDVIPAGPPFWRYRTIEMPQHLDIETGVPTATAIEGEDRVRSGVLPAGRYVTVVHHGHPDGLVDATGRLLDWARQQELRWDMTVVDGREQWGCRLEEYLDDPDDQPDMNQWRTRLAFRLAD